LFLELLIEFWIRKYDIYDEHTHFLTNFRLGSNFTIRKSNNIKDVLDTLHC